MLTVNLDYLLKNRKKGAPILFLNANI